MVYGFLELNQIEIDMAISLNYKEFILPVKSKLNDSQSQIWADLGCGDGVFTKLLAEILPSKSEIIAIDQPSTIGLNDWKSCIFN